MPRASRVVIACALLAATVCCAACGGHGPSRGAVPSSPTAASSPPPPAAPLPLTISAPDAFTLVQNNVNNPDFTILDVRTAAEYAGGHISGAVNIDYYNADFRSTIARLDGGKRYLVYCRSGVRGAAATQMMADLGFTRVQNLAGGLDQWIQDGYPTVL